MLKMHNISIRKNKNEIDPEKNMNMLTIIKNNLLLNIFLRI